MRKYYFRILFFTLSMLLALPAWNFSAFSLGKLGSLKEISVGSPTLRISGYAHEHMQAQFAQHAARNGWDVVVQEGKERSSFDTQVIFYFGPEMLLEIPGASEACAERCVTEDDVALLHSSLTTMGLFARRSKDVFYNLQPLEIDGTVEGTRFECVMERVYLEVIHITVDEDPCEGLYNDNHASRSHRHAVEYPIPLSIWF